MIANGKRPPPCFVSLRRRAAVFRFHPRIVEELAYRLTEDGRKKSRGRQCDPLVENIVLGGEIERELQGTSPHEVFMDVSCTPNRTSRIRCLMANGSIG